MSSPLFTDQTALLLRQGRGRHVFSKHFFSNQISRSCCVSCTTTRSWMLHQLHKGTIVHTRQEHGGLLAWCMCSMCKKGLVSAYLVTLHQNCTAWHLGQAPIFGLQLTQYKCFCKDWPVQHVIPHFLGHIGATPNVLAYRKGREWNHLGGRGVKSGKVIRFQHELDRETGSCKSPQIKFSFQRTKLWVHLKTPSAPGARPISWNESVEGKEARRWGERGRLIGG